MSAGRVKMSQGINGVQTVSSYAATMAHGAAYCITSEQQSNGEPVAGQSTRTVSYIAENGTLIRTENYAYIGREWSLLAYETCKYDIYRNRTKTAKANGRASSTEWMCCGPLREIDEDGIITTYAYNAAHQLIETIRTATTVTPETILSYTNDAEGRTLTTRTDVGAMTTTTSTAYDALGRTVSTMDELGRTTNYEYSPNGLITTTIFLTKAINITTRATDGSITEVMWTTQKNTMHTIQLVEHGVIQHTRIKMGGLWISQSQSLENGFGETVEEQQKSFNDNNYRFNGTLEEIFSKEKAKNDRYRHNDDGI